jgi:hypothetical protein
MTCITSQRCCGGSGEEYDSGTYNSGAEDKSNMETQYTSDIGKNTNIAKGSTNAKPDADKIPTTGGAGGGAAAKDSQGNMSGGGDAKDDNKKYEDVSVTSPGSEICLASKSGCYFPDMCCSGVCMFEMTSSIGMCQ